VAVITDGANGLFAAQNGQILHEPAYHDSGRPLVDDLGAGDAAWPASFTPGSTPFR